MTRRCPVSADLFVEVPRAVVPVPGSMDYRNVIAGMVGSVLEKAAAAGHDRHEIAARMSRYAGREISKYMLDAYSAPSRDDYNMPAWLMPLLEVACESFAYSAWIAEVRGGRLSIGRDALEAELGRITRDKEALQQKERAIRSALRGAP